MEAIDHQPIQAKKPKKDPTRIVVSVKRKNGKEDEFTVNWKKATSLKCLRNIIHRRIEHMEVPKSKIGLYYNNMKLDVHSQIQDYINNDGSTILWRLEDDEPMGELNEAVAKRFDFDGDRLLIHVVQQYEAENKFCINAKRSRAIRNIRGEIYSKNRHLSGARSKFIMYHEGEILSDRKTVNDYSFKNESIIVWSLSNILTIATYEHD